MKKIVIILSLITFILSSLLIDRFYTPSEITAATTPGLDNMLIEYFQNIRENNIFGPVPFNHKKHFVDYELTCLSCHHTWNTKERSGPRKCKECHTIFIDASRRESILLRNAFHGSCKDCHDRFRNENKSTGPIMCGGCHVNNETGIRDQKTIRWYWLSKINVSMESQRLRI